MHRDSFRASRVLAQRVLANKKITVRWNSVVTEFFGEEKEKAEAETQSLAGRYSVGTYHRYL